MELVEKFIELLPLLLPIILIDFGFKIYSLVDILKEDRRVKISMYVEESYLTIKICDNAGGINNENINRIFEPYFSTKSKNSTGLGLYISHVIIVNNLHGKLNVSNLESGACFEIKIPLDKEEKQ